MRGDGSLKWFWDVRKAFCTRNVAVMGMMVAVATVLEPVLEVFITPEIRLFSFSYLPLMIVAVLYGPIAGMAVGFVGDIVSVSVQMALGIGGIFFPGFTASAVLTGLVYAAFLYRPGKEMERASVVWRAIGAQIVILAAITLGINMLWLNLMYGMGAGAIYTWSRVALRLLQFPLDVILVVMLPGLARRLLQYTHRN